MTKKSKKFFFFLKLIIRLIMTMFTKKLFNKKLLNCLFLFQTLNYGNNEALVESSDEQTIEIENPNISKLNDTIPLKINTWKHLQNWLPSSLSLLIPIIIGIALGIDFKNRKLPKAPVDQINEFNFITKLIYDFKSLLDLILTTTNNQDLSSDFIKEKKFNKFNKITITSLIVFFVILITWNIIFNLKQNWKKIIMFLCPILLSFIVSIIMIYSFKFDTTNVKGTQ